MLELTDGNSERESGHCCPVQVKLHVYRKPLTMHLSLLGSISVSPLFWGSIQTDKLFRLQRIQKRAASSIMKQKH